MLLTLIHTAQAHCATFDALRDRIAPDVKLEHLVRPDWLNRAQTGMSPTLESEIFDAVKAAPGPVICTCTTIGTTATDAGAIRIDEPMMHEAARIGSTIMLVYCLESARSPCLNLLNEALSQAGNPATPKLLPLHYLWPLFEAGDIDGFAAGIADDVNDAARLNLTLDCVVLAQASMAAAAALLSELDVAVLSSPELAFRAALGPDMIANPPGEGHISPQ